MLNAKINVNGIEWSLTGDKEDIVYALRNTTSSTLIPNEKEIIGKVPTTTIYKSLSVPSEKGTAKFSKEDTIKMYEYLAAQGDYTIKQFEITRGGKTNPTQYTICLVFDNARQRYCYYNPKTEDTFLQSFSINDVIARINASESGFSLLHTVANKIWEKVNIVDGLSKIITNPFPMLTSPSTTVKFKNYEPKSSFMTGIQNVMKKGEWLTPEQIWNRMTRIGFTTKGKTPANTIASLIYVDTKKNGANSIFERESGKQAFRIRA